ncbi:unnamed protein product [Boreogadus saida]
MMATSYLSSFNDGHLQLQPPLEQLRFLKLCIEDVCKESMNRDIEGKGIVLREYFRSATELPAPELLDCCRTAAEASAAPPEKRKSGLPRSRPAAAEAAIRQLRRCTPGAELPPKLSGCSDGCPPRAEKSGGGSSPDFSPPPDCR